MLPVLAIYRQIGDFGLRRGDKIFGLAIYRQSPKIGDFEPKKLAILAKFNKNWRNWRFLAKIGDFDLAKIKI